jgi:hypothetical protein
MINIKKNDSNYNDKPNKSEKRKNDSQEDTNSKKKKF